MRSATVVVELAVLWTIAAGATPVASIMRNGWYNCSINTFALPPRAEAWSASLSIRRHALGAFVPSAFGPYENLKARIANMFTQCAEFTMPFCHNGTACAASPLPTKSMPLFVKKLSASVSGSKKVLFMLQGGPGASSVAMESLMSNVHDLLFGEFHIFTLDHRGTGRSGFLDCPAAQAQCSGGLGGTAITLDELPGCLNDLRLQFGGNAAAAFSVTNAAKDVTTLIQTELADYDVYLYGVSYGTLLVERVMHFSPPQVKGYILDSIVADHHHGSNSQVFTNSNDDLNAVSRQFLDLCSKDTAGCGELLGPNATAALFNLYETLDSNASACSSLFYRTLNETPSVVLRQFFAALLGDLDRRVFIPTFAARVRRCNDQDKTLLTALLMESPDHSDTMSSGILHDTIGFAELWHVLTPSMADLAQKFMASPMAQINSDEVGRYCLYTRSNATNCAPWANATAPVWTYQVDKYFNKTAGVPNGTSVLGLAGKLDPVTPATHARRHFENMEGSNKRLLEFPVAVHGVITSTPVASIRPGPPCAMVILAAYLRENGALASMDTSCIANVYPLRFDISDAMAQRLFGLDGGAMDGHVANPVKDANKYKTKFTRMMVGAIFLAVVVLAIAFYAFVKHREAKAIRDKYAVYEDASSGD
ncbi:hypothetical protein H310_09841 [Aphanomyces invadans]|uniref:AB hydrolase-1 domain-containing protein n=1 Tax=Aphanomyces invadans TaxID=157072 RepID=A0A024TUJ5_9STRA|nr:hypothetical protein H310_09841 [Aphanomyces invadans]ETV96992.1 hypothetical protein H310_09841 [Aphanomyces invadans]|eukprot:XP_008874238.1 hypothetical protein H310_09841 [Aphanomyces invadans]